MLCKCAEDKGFKGETWEAYGQGCRGKKAYDPTQDLTRAPVQQLILNKILLRTWWWVHFGITCTSWSAMQFSFGGTRTHQSPLGTRERPAEIVGNLEANAMFKFIYALIAVGAHFTIEHPEMSLLWSHPKMRQLIDSGLVHSITTDMCMHGLKSPPEIQPVEYYKKPTRIVGTFPDLWRLARRCDGSHRHTTLGRRRQLRLPDGASLSRAQWAGQYTSLFSSRLARIAACARDEDA